MSFDTIKCDSPLKVFKGVFIWGARFENEYEN